MKTHVRRYFKYSCNSCSKRYFRARHLQIHLKNAHLPSKKLECPICHKVFKAVNNLKQHLHLHSDERPYVCDYEGCDKSFKQKPGLQQHIRFMHNSNDTYCKTCRKRVPDLEKHMKENHPGAAKRKKDTQKVGKVAKKPRKDSQNGSNDFDDTEDDSDDEISATWKYSNSSEDEDKGSGYSELFADLL